MGMISRKKYFIFEAIVKGRCIPMYAEPVGGLHRVISVLSGDSA